MLTVEEEEEEDDDVPGMYNHKSLLSYFIHFNIISEKGKSLVWLLVEQRTIYLD